MEGAGFTVEGVRKGWFYGGRAGFTVEGVRKGWFYGGRVRKAGFMVKGLVLRWTG